MDIKDVENLAELARLELSADEKSGLLKDMKGILEYVKQIERPGADIGSAPAAPGSVPGDSNVGTGTYNIWREDKIEFREFSRELITEQFPDAQDGFLKVKKIL